MGKFNTLTTREIINPDTGELTVVETCKSFTTKIEEDTFYMTFTEFISPFFNLNSDNAKNLLVWMLNHAEFNTGKVWLTTANRKKISQDINLSNNTITNCLKVLKEKRLISGEEGSFIINPQIFWKGELAARKELLKDANIVITFGIESKE